MAPEQDPIHRKPLTAEDLPPDALVTGGPTMDRLRHNPAAYEHAPTICSMPDVNGNPVEVVRIQAVSLAGATSTRVEPEVRKHVLGAPELWSDDLAEHHVLTHALRLFQMVGATEKTRQDLPPRRVLPDNISPKTILTTSGMPGTRVNGVLRALKDNGLVCDYERSGRSKRWVIDNQIKAIGADGSKYTATDLLPGLRMRDAAKPQVKVVYGNGGAAPQTSATEQTEENPFYVGPRPRFETQTDRHLVLDKAHRALVFLAVAAGATPDENNLLKFTTVDSLVSSFRELTGTEYSQAHSIIDDLKVINKVKTPLRIRGNAGMFEWTIGAYDTAVTPEDVQKIRVEKRKVRAARVAAKAGVVQAVEVVPSEAVEAALPVPPAETSAIEAGNEPREGEPEDINEVLRVIGDSLQELETENESLKAENVRLAEELASAQEEARQNKALFDDLSGTHVSMQNRVNNLQDEVDDLTRKLADAQAKKPVVEIPDSLRKYIKPTE